MSAGALLPYFEALKSQPAVLWRGRVTQVVGSLLESTGPPCSLGECCQVRDSAGHTYSGEVVGFRGTTVLTMPLEKPSVVRYGDTVVALGVRPCLAVGEELLG
ncbi:MAG: flagellum-specific ATP synthase FliI, partial [Candidatus Korobacteraceae bacterium]